MSGNRKINHIEYSTKYVRSFHKLPHLTQEKARMNEEIFCSDPFDPRLQTHKLHGKFQQYLAYSVDRRYRVIFRFISGSEVLFFDIGLHKIYGAE